MKSNERIIVLTPQKFDPLPINFSLLYILLFINKLITLIFSHTVLGHKGAVFVGTQSSGRALMTSNSNLSDHGPIEEYRSKSYSHFDWQCREFFSSGHMPNHQLDILPSQELENGKQH